MADKQVDGLTAKTTPVDADLIPLWDSEEAGAEALKKITWANLVPSGKNVIINGDFNLWQRYGTSISPVTSHFTADRFLAFLVGAGVADVDRDTDVPTFAESDHLSSYSLKFDCTTADASIAAGDVAGINYSVEGYDYRMVAGGNATLSFWVKAVKTGTYCIAFRNSGSDRSYVVEYTISAASTWEKKTVTVPLTQTAGTWDYTNGIGLIITWAIMAGSTYQTTADAWQTGNFVATSNQVNGIDNTNNNFWLSQIKFEPGDIATKYITVPAGLELRNCQRYFHKSFNLGTDPADSVNSYTSVCASWSTGDARSAYVTFPVKMRTTPTVVFCFW